MKILLVSANTERANMLILPLGLGCNCAARSPPCPSMTWRCILYPERVREELVAAMAAAGCSEVALKFESGCERTSAR